MKARPISERFAEKVVKAESGCHEWIGCLMPNGYGQVHLNGKTAYAHRVAYELTNGPIQDGLFVMHSCDNRKCVNPDHLSLGTCDNNMSDMVNTTRQAAGMKNSHAKLTDEQVRQIRIESGNHSATARRYGVSQTTISEIRARKIWRHI
jgi:hypothetical protein